MVGRPNPSVLGEEIWTTLVGLAVQQPRLSNRAFGLAFAGLFLVISSIAWLVFDTTLEWALITSGCFALVALIYPPVLLVPNLIWSKLAARIATVNNFLILSLVFYLVITPVSLAMRFFGRNLMSPKRAHDEVSFLTPVTRQETAETLADQF